MLQPDISAELRLWLDQHMHDLQECVELSGNYHGKRERFLLFCDRACQATAALTASAAFAQAVAPHLSISTTVALVAAVASVLPLVFGLSAAANRHAVLASEHRRLRSQMAGCGDACSVGQYDAFHARYHEIQAGEPASLGALVVQCQNEIAMAKGHPEKVIPINWWRRLWMHVWDFQFEELPPRKSVGEQAG